MATCGFSNGFDSGFAICLRPAVVTVEGVAPFEEVVELDPILMARAHAGPLRELYDAAERFDKRERE